MSHLKLQSQSRRSKTYRQVLMQPDCRRNQFTLLKERSQDIVHRFEHRLHECISGKINQRYHMNIMQISTDDDVDSNNERTSLISDEEKHFSASFTSLFIGNSRQSSYGSLQACQQVVRTLWNRRSKQKYGKLTTGL
ncbi:hypothetical protein PV326_011660 [Microctonus aethiopoides]|nr:hypothetical protein PV326_011660 [Microctonus aethiopoides]